MHNLSHFLPPGIHLKENINTLQPIITMLLKFYDTTSLIAFLMLFLRCMFLIFIFIGHFIFLLDSLGGELITHKTWYKFWGGFGREIIFLFPLHFSFLLLSFRFFFASHSCFFRVFFFNFCWIRIKVRS